MNKAELRRQLEALGVRDDSYSLDGPSGEAYCLNVDRGQWKVFYYERGIETDPKDFGTESEACEYLLEVVSGDPTTRAV